MMVNTSKVFFSCFLRSKNKNTSICFFKNTKKSGIKHAYRSNRGRKHERVRNDLKKG